VSGVRDRNLLLEAGSDADAEAGAEAGPGEAQWAADAELLGRARFARQRQVVPHEVRQRLLARTLDELRRPSGVLPASELVPAPARRLGAVLGCAASLALAVVLVAQLRGDPAAAGGVELAGETGASPEAELAPEHRRVAGGVFQSALFHAPAALASSPPPPLGASLFGERPFAASSSSWQVRRWPDLSAGPAQPAEHAHEDGALCVPLGAHERIVGGWPWLSEAGQPPRTVALAAGKTYRLVFQAWAAEPSPGQVLIGVGHAALPFSAAGGARVPVTSKRQFFEVRFTAAHDDTHVGVAFLATGDGAASTRLCLGDMTLTESLAR
jgi:hypothetical protein